MIQAARGWANAVRVHRVVILGLALAVFLSIGMAQPDGTRRGVAMVVVGLAVVIALSLGSQRVWPLWRATGGVVAASLLAVLFAVTGGIDSVYQDTVVAVMVASALTLPLRLLLVNVTAAIAAAGSPLLYDPAFDAVWATDMVADVGVWLAVTAAVYLQTQLLRHQADDLRESEKLQRAFLRATSHELRTPLTAVSGFAETLERRGEDLSREQRQRMATQMAVNAQRLNALVTDLLDVDRLASGAVNANREPQDLALLVERVVREVEAGDRHVDLDLDTVVADVDGPKIERVVANLVTNAVRHTPPTGTVAIEVGADGERAIIRVSDDGPGIPSGYEDRIFEPFVQGPERRKDANPGTGVGLTLVKGFVELHGGAVHAQRRVPVGSCVEVVLPIRADRATTHPRRGDAPAA
jgi:signal transduction histidine kinase